MFKKSYKGRSIKLAAKKSLAVSLAIVTSFIVILAVSLSTLINKGLVNAFSDSVTPAPSTASTTSESTADLVKSTEISSSKENKANKENVEESKPQSEITGETHLYGRNSIQSGCTGSPLYLCGRQTAWREQRKGVLLLFQGSNVFCP